MNDLEVESFSTKNSNFMLNPDLINNINNKNNGTILSPVIGHVSPNMTDSKYQHKNGYHTNQKYPASNNQMNSQYMFNIASQPFFPAANANNLYNVASLQLLNPSLPHIGPFANETNSFFYDKNNNTNESFQGFHQAGNNFDREFQVITMNFFFKVR